jgi:hypothetical protein
VSGADPARAQLDAAVLRWMREADWCDDEARFGELALALFAFQFERCEPYRRFCERRGRTPATLSGWREIPPVPTGAFKELSLTSFPAARTVQTFRTSGTSAGARGALHLDTLELYEASLLPTFRRHVLPDLASGHRVRFAVLAPAPAETPDSSLSHMFGVVLDALGDAESRFLVREGSLHEEGAIDALRDAVESATPLALCGTAFAFAHLLEGLADGNVAFALPAGSRVMETGGFKGRSRELPRDELYTWIEERLGVPPARIVNQYGMTELGSQFYDSVLRRPGEARRKQGPPWARVRIADPESGEDVRPGAAGAIVVVDLANTGSVLALQTADLGRQVGDGFEILGRMPGAEQRGCSIAADELLASAAS